MFNIFRNLFGIDKQSMPNEQQNVQLQAQSSELLSYQNIQLASSLAMQQGLSLSAQNLGMQQNVQWNQDDINRYFKEYYIKNCKLGKVFYND